MVDWVDGMPRMVDWLEAVGDLALVTVTLHGGMLVPVGLHMVMVGQRGDDGGGHHEARRELSHDGAGAWLVAVLGWSLERGRFSTDGSCVRSSIYTNTARYQELYHVLRTIAVEDIRCCWVECCVPSTSTTANNPTTAPHQHPVVVCCRQSPGYETLHYVCVEMPRLISQLPPLKSIS